MAQEATADRKSEQPQTTTTTVGAPEVAATPTSFVAGGPIPPVASGGLVKSTPTATASAQAFDTGIEELKKLLAKGRPEPKTVVELIDTFRPEHDAMLTLVESTLGADYAGEVRAAMGLRASIKRKELADGDPGDPNGGYFVASQELAGAKWRTKDGGFTGTANKDGLDSTVKLDENDALHAKVKADKSGTLAWEHDGKTAAELYGSYEDGKNHDVGVRRTWGVGAGQLTTSLDRKDTKGVETDAAIAAYKSGDGKTTATASAGVENGTSFEALQAQRALDETTTVSGNLRNDAKGLTATTTATEKLSPHWSLSETAGATMPHGGKLAPIGGLGATYKDESTSLGGNITRGADNTSLHVNGTEKLSPAWTLGQTLDAKLPDHGKASVTGALTAGYKQGNNSFDGSVTRGTDNTKLHAGGSQVIDTNWKLTEKADVTVPDHGKSQSVLSLGETYSHGNVVESANLDAGIGTQNYLKTTGAIDAKLAPNLYAGGFGAYSYNQGKQDTAQVGASLTFTPNEKQALTLAGVLDQHGVFEARLQFDVFKSRIESVQDLAAHKKDALVSLFVSYRQDAGSRALDDRFGAPTVDAGHGQSVNAGIRIKF